MAIANAFARGRSFLRTFCVRGAASFAGTVACDALVVGAGPAGLAFAIRMRQIDPAKRVVVLEKAIECGAHELSGCVLDTRALEDLIPTWKEDQQFPAFVEVVENEVFHATPKALRRMPTPPAMRSSDTVVVSLSQMVRWMAKKAMDLGVEVIPSCAAQKPWLANDKVVGVVTSSGERVRAGITALAEGCRGNVSETVIDTFHLRKGQDPPKYGLGLKEVWEVEAGKHIPGRVWSIIGWPLEEKAVGRGFVYHEKQKGRVSVGLTVGLDYSNPYISPFREFQMFKMHPKVQSLLEGGMCLQYGARALNEGGLQSVPQLHFPGGVLLGCAGGLLDVAKTRGVHTAMMSGILAAEETKKLQHGIDGVDNAGYTRRLHESWVWKELYQGRNVRPGFAHGWLFGLANAAMESFFLKGRVPWTLHHTKDDRETTGPAAEHEKIEYPEPDGKLTFDVRTSLLRSGIIHTHNQPSHLLLHDENVPSEINYNMYAGLEEQYCPANVFEYVAEDTGDTKLQINARDCLHCKACDIKDPTHNIRWTPPKNGSGPHYEHM